MAPKGRSTAAAAPGADTRTYRAAYGQPKIKTKLILQVLPYIIDLGSANGTYLNNQKIEAQRYVELKEKDVLKFGYSSREYVLLHENSDGGD